MRLGQTTGERRVTSNPPALLHTLARLSVASTLLFAFLSSFTTTASACGLTDPNCVVDKVKETADNAVDDIEETVDQVDETVDHVEETANDAVEDIKDTAGGAVGGIKETVDETLNPGGGGGTPETPDAPGNPNVDKPNVKEGTNDRPRTPNANNGRGPERGPQGSRDTNGRFGRRNSLLAPISLPVDLAAPASGFTESADITCPELSPGLGESAIEAAKDFAFPLLLTLIVGGFLLAQNRVDRKEAKLRYAPVDQDLLSFE